jgi:membrane protein
MTVAELTQRFWGSLLGRMVQGMIQINIVDRALAMSSKAFVVLLPLTIITGAIVQGESLGDSLVARFDLTGAGAEAARTLFESPDAVRAGISAFGIGFLVFGSLSLARGLERIYLDAWELESLDGSILRRLGWIASVVGFLAVAGPIRAYLDDVGVQLELAAVNVALGTLMWMWTPYVLLAQRIPARALLPTGLLTAVATTGLGIASLVYMPTVMTTNADRYGLIGVAFALVSWLFAYACAIIAAIVIGAVLAGREPLHDEEARTT